MAFETVPPITALGSHFTLVRPFSRPPDPSPCSPFGVLRPILGER
ncbi:hypothetical protein LINPERHAP1_LOCUS39569 [Linum perenne]